ncbi:MAG: hypothetical protein KAU38_01200, partial [Desulfobacterales bacterium]|nr:hypothetical protein [Desulfobacterales bacterium]
MNSGFLLTGFTGFDGCFGAFAFRDERQEARKSQRSCLPRRSRRGGIVLGSILSDTKFIAIE